LGDNHVAAEELKQMIMREWRAQVRRGLRDEYVEYIRRTGLAGYEATPGNSGAAVAVRDLDEHRSEVLTLSCWESLDAIRKFAGDPVERARYFPEDDRYLLTRPELVVHYRIFQQGWARERLKT